MAAKLAATDLASVDLGERRLYRRVADVIEARIRSGEFPEGSRLPTERELSAALGVSRTVLREALIALEISGLIKIRMGSGVFVTAVKKPAGLPASDLSPIEDAGPFEIIDARMGVEPEVAANAASRRTPNHILRLEAAIEVLIEEHRNNAARQEGDKQFHLALADASGNAILAHLVSELWQLNQSVLWDIYREWVRQPRLRLLWIEDHQRILEAIRRGDRRKARAAMRQHLRNVEQSLKEVPIGTE